MNRKLLLAGAVVALLTPTGLTFAQPSHPSSLAQTAPIPPTPGPGIPVAPAPTGAPGPTATPTPAPTATPGQPPASSQASPGQPPADDPTKKGELPDVPCGSPPPVVPTPAAQNAPAPTTGAPAAPTGTAPTSATPASPSSVPDAGTAAGSPAPDKDAADKAAAAKAAAAIPKIQEEVAKSCAQGKVIMKVGSRLYGHKIGDSIPVELTITLNGGAVIDTSPMLQGKLRLEAGNQPFELTAKPVIEEKTAKDGAKQYHILLQVRQFLPAPNMTFAMQLPYAVKFAEDGTPLWETLATPDYILVQNMEGLSNQERPLTDGNTGLVQPRHSWALPAGIIFVALLFLAYPLVELVRLCNRVRPRKVVPRQVAAWLAMNRVLKSGKEIGFSNNHYRRMGEVLRTYLTASIPGIQGMTQTELESLPDDGQGTTVKSAFRKLDGALIGEKRLSAAEQEQLLREVEELLPRPFSL